MKNKDSEQESCKGIIGAVFGHSFKPRYTNSAEAMDSINQSVKSIKDIVVGFKSSGSSSRDEYVTVEGFKVVKLALKATEGKGTYVKDVCARCGAQKLSFFNTQPNVARQLDSDL